MGDISMITDDATTQSMDGLVELRPGVQNVNIDPGGNHEAYAILFWHSYVPRAYLGIVVLLREDKEITEGVQTIFNNDRENKDGRVPERIRTI
jgi:hypothetical protein